MTQLSIPLCRAPPERLSRVDPRKKSRARRRYFRSKRKRSLPPFSLRAIWRSSSNSRCNRRESEYSRRCRPSYRNRFAPRRCFSSYSCISSENLPFVSFSIIANGIRFVNSMRAGRSVTCAQPGFKTESNNKALKPDARQLCEIVRFRTYSNNKALKLCPLLCQTFRVSEPIQTTRLSNH